MATKQVSSPLTGWKLKAAVKSTLSRVSDHDVWRFLAPASQLLATYLPPECKPALEIIQRFGDGSAKSYERAEAHRIAEEAYRTHLDAAQEREYQGSRGIGRGRKIFSCEVLAAITSDDFDTAIDKLFDLFEGGAFEGAEGAKMTRKLERRATDWLKSLKSPRA
jgi:hypothetical protein